MYYDYVNRRSLDALRQFSVDIRVNARALPPQYAFIALHAVTECPQVT